MKVAIGHPSCLSGHAPVTVWRVNRTLLLLRSVAMTGTKLTAQQYQECWRERIEKEQKATAQAVADGAAQVASKPPAATSATGADDTVSAISTVSRASAGSGFNESIMSSRVSSSSAANRKLEALQAKLEEERKKRRELEHALKAAQQPS